MSLARRLRDVYLVRHRKRSGEPCCTVWLPVAAFAFASPTRTVVSGAGSDQVTSKLGVARQDCAIFFFSEDTVCLKTDVSPGCDDGRVDPAGCFWRGVSMLNTDPLITCPSPLHNGPSAERPSVPVLTGANASGLAASRRWGQRNPPPPLHPVKLVLMTLAHAH